MINDEAKVIFFASRGPRLDLLKFGVRLIAIKNYVAESLF